MIMFVFVLIILREYTVAVPIVERSSVSDAQMEGTTSVPHGMMNQILMSNVQRSSKHFPGSAHALQSAMKMLFPKKSSSIDRQSLLIGCVINRGKASEEQRRACKRLHQKKDKNVFYGFDDKSLEENSTVTTSNQLPVHHQHMNAARVESDEDRSINTAIKKIQKLIASENDLIKNEATEGKTSFNSLSRNLSGQNLISSSKLLGARLNTINLNRSRDGNDRKGFSWLLKNYAIGKTTKNLLNTEFIKHVRLLNSMYRKKEQDDVSNSNRKNAIQKDRQVPPMEEDSTEEDHENPLNIHVVNETDSNSHSDEKIEPQNRIENKPTVGQWNLDRFSDDRTPKNALLTDLAIAKVLGTIVDGKGSDSDDDRISFKPADLRSIINSPKVFWKLLQFLNTIKNTIE